MLRGSSVRDPLGAGPGTATALGVCRTLGTAQQDWESTGALGLVSLGTPAGRRDWEQPVWMELRGARRGVWGGTPLWKVRGPFASPRLSGRWVRRLRPGRAGGLCSWPRSGEASIPAKWGSATPPLPRSQAEFPGCGATKPPEPPRDQLLPAAPAAQLSPAKPPPPCRAPRVAAAPQPQGNQGAPFLLLLAPGAGRSIPWDRRRVSTG